MSARARGLTLIELLVVMVVMVVITGVVVPSFVGILAHSRLNAAARGVLAQCRYARSEAVRRRTYTRVTVDSVAQLHGVVVLCEDQDTGEQEWRPLTDNLGAPRSLPEGVEFGRLIARDESGEVLVTYYPDGRGEDGYLTLADRHERKLALRLTGITGRAEVVDPLSDEAADRLAAGEPR